MSFFSWMTGKTEKKKWGRNDWLILILLGVLLMIVALPSKEPEDEPLEKEKEKQETSAGVQDQMTTEEYVSYLERKLADILSEMRGIGQVDVMITLCDEGETVVNKDVSQNENSYEESTTLLEGDDITSPYVTKQKYPAVEGVVVVAEGAGNAGISTDITETVMALFDVEVHKVKVLSGR